jgi:hypothetical protein
MEQLFEKYDALVARADQSSKQLNAACAPHKGAMGLVSDEFRKTDTYASLSNLYALDKELLRLFWKSLGTQRKPFTKALNDRSRARRMAKVGK